MADPYLAISDPDTICTYASHSKKKMKNCNHPWCCSRLGEYTRGIWQTPVSNCQLMLSLGNDITLSMRIEEELHQNEKEAKQIKGRLLPPVGLKNLGATCYLNVLIQSLFYNLMIRDAVYSIKEAESSSDTNKMNMVLKCLQNAFGHLDKSMKSVYNLSDFVNLLGLNTGEQQDPLEFNKLFFDKMKAVLRDINHFTTGKEQYYTKCSTCGYTSSKEDEFQEITLPIENYKNISQSLEARLSLEEELIDDNRYECPQCKCKRDAVRGYNIVKTPSVLLVQLMRYIYDLVKFDKKKIQTSIEFPETLNLCDETYVLVSVFYHIGKSAYGGHYVADVLNWEHGDWWLCDDDTVIPSVNPAAKTDSSVTANELVDLSSSPTSSSKMQVDKSIDLTMSADDNSGVGDENDPDDNKNGDDEALVDSDEEEHEENVPKKKSKAANGTTRPVLKKKTLAKKGTPKKKKTKTANDITSKLNRCKDAYMLTYVKLSDLEAAKAKQRNKIPAFTLETLNNNNVVFTSEVTSFNKKKEGAQQIIKERMDIYEAVKDILVPDSSDAPFHLVPTDWLTQWITGEKIIPKAKKNVKKVDEVVNLSDVNTTVPSSSSSSSAAPISLLDDDEDELVAAQPNDANVPYTQQVALFSEKIDNSNCFCPHNLGMHPNKIKEYKVLSDVAYEAIASPYCDQDFNFKNYRCNECADGMRAVAEDLRIKSNRRYSLLNRIEKGIIHATTVEQHEDVRDDLYYIPKKWKDELSKSMKKMEKDSKKLGSGTATPGTLDEYLKVNKGSDNDSVHSDKNSNNDLEDVTYHLRCSHGNFSPKKAGRLLIEKRVWDYIVEEFPRAVDNAYPFVNTEDCPLCLVSAAEDNDARNKKMEEKSKQKTHPELKKLLNRNNNESYPSEFRHKHRYNEDNTDSLIGNVFYLVSGDWLHRWRVYLKNNQARPEVLTNVDLKCSHDHCLLSMFLQSCVDNPPLNAEDDDRQDLPEQEIINQECWNEFLDCGFIDDITWVQKLYYDFEQEMWTWNIDRCDECILNAVTKGFEAKITFTQKQFKIRDITHLHKYDFFEERSSVDISSGMKADRRSKRARGKEIKVKLTSTDTLRILKLKIYEADDVAPNCQTLYHKGKELKDLDVTLAKLGIAVGEEIELVKDDSKEADASEIWNEYYNHSATETGFRNTFLGGGGGQALNNNSNNNLSNNQAGGVDDEVMVLERPSTTNQNSESLDQLLAMGFERPAAEKSLRESNGDIEQATNMLLSASN